MKNKCIKDKNSKWKHIAIALMITAGLQILFMLIAKISYENGDDQQIANFIYSYYGSYKGDILFMNVILERLLSYSASIFKTIPVYGIIQLGLIDICSVIVNYLLLEKYDKKAFIPFFLLYVCFGYQLFAQLQFTKTAAICTITGFLWMFSIYENKGKGYLNIFPFLFIVTGSLFRFNAFELACLVCGFVGICHLIHCRKVKEFASLCIPVGLAFLCVFGLRIINVQYYNSETYQEYRTFSSLRASVLDDGVMEYESNSDAFNEIGIEQEEYNVMYNWEFIDLNVFNSDLFKKVETIRDDSTKLSAGSLITSFIKIAGSYYLYIIASLSIIVIGLRKSEHKVYWLFESLFILFIEVYLVINGRYLINRIQMPIFFGYYIILCLYVLDEVYFEAKKVILPCLVVTTGISGYSFYGQKTKEQALLIQHQQYDAIENSFINDSSHVYFTMAKGNLILCDQMGVFERYPDSYFNNVMKITSWEAYSPDMLQRLCDLGIENFYQDIIDNPKYYLAKPGTLDDEIAYIRKHYNENAQAVLVKTIYDYHVYQVVTKELSLNDDQIKSSNETVNCTIQNNEIKGSVKNYKDSYVYVGIQDDTQTMHYYYTTVDENGDFNGTIDQTGTVTIYLQTNDTITKVIPEQS